MRLSIFCVVISFIYLAEITSAKANNTVIPSSMAICQTGRFAINYSHPLCIDKESSLKLNEFIAYQGANDNKIKILLGPVAGQVDLKQLCMHPQFLVNEQIPIPDHMIPKFFKKPLDGCIVKLDSNKSLLIAKHPIPFTDQQGRQIKYIALVSNQKQFTALLNNLNFNLTAEQFYINLLQIGQTFSPFSKAIDWETIKRQGLKIIGEDRILCKGLYAAALQYLPELRKHDSHSFISLNGLDSKQYPPPKIALDENIRKWLENPPAIREKIINYSKNFHGKNLDGICYLYIPAIEAYSSDKINEFVKEGREALEQANAQKTKGLIIDLRFNTGGDLKSMLLTLGGVLPKGKLIGLNPTTFISLSNDGNHLQVAREIYAEYQSKKPFRLPDVPIAILINGITASSAEMTALSLKKNLPHAKLFGTRSSGALSTNQTFFLWDGNTLNLMVERIYDKAGNIMPLYLSVDEEIKENLATVFDPVKDRVIQNATAWIHSISRNVL